MTSDATDVDDADAEQEEDEDDEDEHEDDDNVDEEEQEEEEEEEEEEDDDDDAAAAAAAAAADDATAGVSRKISSKSQSLSASLPSRKPGMSRPRMSPKPRSRSSTSESTPMRRSVTSCDGDTGGVGSIMSNFFHRSSDGSEELITSDVDDVMENSGSDKNRASLSKNAVVAVTAAIFFQSLIAAIIVQSSTIVY